MAKPTSSSGFWALLPLQLALLVGLGLTSTYSYLLFHCLVELFSIVISGAIFMFAWNSRRYHQDNFFVFLGIAYLFIGGIDLFHTLAYEGMRIFTDYDYYANQLWIGARALESVSLAVAFMFLGRYRSPRLQPLIFTFYAGLTLLLLSSVFGWKIFPVCFIEGQGQTLFKKYSEYTICLILFADLALLYRCRHAFSRRISMYLAGSLLCTIGAELAFAFYVSNYGLSNFTGHYFKLFSFYLMYRAIIETGFTQPLSMLFQDLQASRDALRHDIAKREQVEAQLRELNASKDKFFSIISHDLRSPLGCIVNSSQLLNDHLDELNQADVAQLSQILRTSSHNLMRRLNNLLEWSQLQTGHLRCHPQSVVAADIVDPCLQVVAPMATAKSVSLHADVATKLPMLADPNMLSTVLHNLLTNAIKFTAAGGSVWVELRQDSPSHVRITVRDTGIGMSREQLAALFRLDQAQSTVGTNGEEGTGLGLLLCRELVEQNGGELSVESDPGHGSCFSFTVPLAEVEIMNVAQSI